MHKLRVADEAELDLNEIGNYIAVDSPANASRFVQRLRKNFTLLCQHPFIGRTRDDLSTGLRSISFGYYVIYYRVSKTEVEIARVIHSARDITHIFGSS